MGDLRRRLEARLEALCELLLASPAAGPTMDTWETPGDRRWDVRDRLAFIHGTELISELDSRDSLLLDARRVVRPHTIGSIVCRRPTDKALLLTMHRILFLVRRAIHTKQLNVDIADDEVLYKSADVVLRLGGTL